MQTVQIIEAKREDLQDLQQVSRVTFRESFGEQNTPEDMEKYLTENLSLERLSFELENPESEFYMARCNDEVLGYLKLNVGQAQTELKDDKGLEIERIYVVKSHVGEGIGKQLFEFTLDTARRKGKYFIWLGVWEKNEHSISTLKMDL